MTKDNDTWVEVLWLRPHRQYAYFPGEIGTVQRQHLPELLGGKTDSEESTPPYVKVLSPDEKAAILNRRKPLPAPDEPLVCVRFLKPNPQYGYSKNQLGKIYISAAQALAAEDYIEPLTEEEYQEITTRKPAVPSESDFEKVIFLKYHRDFSYSEGDIGLVAKAKLPDLLEGGYVDYYREPKPGAKPTVWDQFISKLKK